MARNLSPRRPMDRFLTTSAVCALTLAAFTGTGHALQIDPPAPDELESDRGPAVSAGSAFTRALARLDENGRVTIDLAIELHLPISLPAGTYAQIYGITREMAQQIIEVAVAEGLDPDLGFRLVRVESVFRTSARGPRGALGLTQLMPSTARAIDRSLRSDAEILDPATNLRLGFRYLRRMIEKYDGDVRLGLLAYNRGEGTVSRALRQGRDPENGYSRKVLGGRSRDPYSGTGLLPRHER